MGTEAKTWKKQPCEPPYGCTFEKKGEQCTDRAPICCEFCMVARCGRHWSIHLDHEEGCPCTGLYSSDQLVDALKAERDAALEGKVQALAASDSKEPPA